MTRILVALEKGLAASPIRLVCAISGDCSGLRGESRSYDDLRDLQHALAIAGVAAYITDRALKAVLNGYPSFFTVSVREAKSLGVLFGTPEE